MAAVLFLTIFISHSAAAQHENRKEILFEAMSPYEDLTEFALADNAAGVESAIRSLIISKPRQKAVLPKHIIDHLSDNIEKMAVAQNSGDYAVIAQCAVDSYKTLVDELEAAESDIQAGVQYLDFVGFDVHALLKQKEMDWESIRTVVREGSSRWNTIKRRVRNKALKDSMDTAIGGLIAATESGNREMLAFAAQIDLDLVDLLEVSVESEK